MKTNFRNRSSGITRPGAMGRLVALGVVIGSTVLPCRGQLHPAREAPVAVTNLAQLDGIVEMDQRRNISIHVEATVWWSSAAEGRIIVHDDSAVVQLELGMACEIPRMGDRFRLSGDCSVLKVQDVIKLSSMPVVENDGLHPSAEQSGRIYLPKGYHPIRISWFNRRIEYSLNVEYEGPQLRRQSLPDDVLYHAETDPMSGATNFIRGLEYLCYEGLWLDYLPYMSRLNAAKSGISERIDLGVRSRDFDVALDFSGYIRIDAAGEYTFYIASDDGSRVYLGPPSLATKRIGRGVLPVPQPLHAEGTIREEPEYQWAEVEGEVSAYQRFKGVLSIDLITPRGEVTLKVAEDPDRTYILLPGNRIRAVGAGRKIYSAGGQPSRCEFYVQQWSNLEQTYITPRIWSEHPLAAVSNITHGTAFMENSIVHLRGEIVPEATGQRIFLKDATGRIVLDDRIPPDLLHQPVDVIGRLALDGTERVLRFCVFRPLREAGPDSEELPLLTTNEQVVQLSLREAARGYPVKVRGVITCLLEYEGAVLQDSSRGIYLNCWGMGSPSNLRVGDYCEIEGMTVGFDFNPLIQVSQIRKLGKRRLPDPVRPNWDQLINGSLQCNYVELEGLVESIEGDTVMLLTHDGNIKVRLNPSGSAMPAGSVGATVRMRGCLLADWDAESRRVVVGSIFLDQQRITVMSPPPTDPFSIPHKHIGDLLRFDPQGGALQRVKVSGILIHQHDQVAYLMDEEHGLRFMSLGPIDADPGDRVEVVGFPDLNGPSPLLRNSVVHRTGRPGLPAPAQLSADDLLQDKYDATLVQVSGTLLDISRREDGVELEMQSGLRRYAAKIHSYTEGINAPKPGSRLELTGVYIGQGGNRVLGRPIDSFELRLQSGSGIRVLSNPPWWTFRRLMMVMGMLLAFLSASLVWINLLRQKVESRTLQLVEQSHKREHAERQRQIEQERARLAHDLHDDLGSGLAEVNLLSRLASSPEVPAEERNEFTQEVNSLISRMVLSLDEIVWAENPKNDTIASLAGYFGAHAQRLLEMASVNCGLNMQEDLPDLPLDPKFRREMFLAFKEAITNIINHAEATKAWLRIAVEQDELVVEIADNGCGIGENERREGSDGLDNMHHRMTAIDGTCEIRSDSEKGTTIRLRAPIRRVGEQ